MDHKMRLGEALNRATNSDYEGAVEVLSLELLRVYGQLEMTLEAHSQMGKRLAAIEHKLKRMEGDSK